MKWKFAPTDIFDPIRIKLLKINPLLLIPFVVCFISCGKMRKEIIRS